MKKIISVIYLILSYVFSFSQSTPELVAADIISVSLPLSKINQTCDVYKTSSTNAPSFKFIHTPYFSFKKTVDGKIDVKMSKASPTKSNIELTLLCSPQDLKKIIADYIREDARRRNNTQLKDINEKDIITPNFISIRIEDITPDADIRFLLHEDTRNIYVASIPIIMTVNTSDATKIANEFANGIRIPHFKITYTLNAKFIQSSSEVFADVASVYDSRSFQDLSGAASAFSWAGNYTGGTVTKNATTLTRSQKQNFEGRLKHEISVAYDIESDDDLRFLQEQIDKYGQDIFKKATIDLAKGEFAQELSKLSSYGFSNNDIQPDRIDSFFSKLKDYLSDEKKSDLDVVVKAGGSALFGLISGNVDTKVTKNEFVKQLRDNGWEFEQKGNIYIPKSLEIWMQNETGLQQHSSIRVKISRSKRDAFKQALIITTNENAYSPEVQNFATFYETFISNSCPVGTILPFGGAKDKIPSGWQLCNGDPLDTLNFKELFLIIGYNWGHGLNGQFNKPDLRAAFMRGLDDGRNIDPEASNRAIGSRQEHALQNHYHNAIKVTGHGNGSRPFGERGGSENRFEQSYPQMIRDAYNANISSETRPFNYAVNYIIRCR